MATEYQKEKARERQRKHRAKNRKLHYPDPMNHPYTLCGKIYNYKPNMADGAPVAQSRNGVTCGVCKNNVNRISPCFSFIYEDLA